MTSSRPPLVAVLAALAVSFILVGRSGGPLAAEAGALRTAARAALVPMEVAGDAVFQPLEGAVSGLERSTDLARAVAAVERERERAESESARADALAAENERLAALLGLDWPAAADGVAARVVSMGPAAAGGTLVINRGDAAGIRVGMPVVAAGGLVGRISEVGPGHSTVLPLTDPASAVGVRCVSAPSGLVLAGQDASSLLPGGTSGGPPVGVAQGHGGPTLRLDLLDPAGFVESGALIVTSGLRHSLFPAGLPVGRVTGSPGRFGVQPFAPPDRQELVKVLRWEPKS